MLPAKNYQNRPMFYEDTAYLQLV